MPNWCNNSIEIVGPRDKIRAIWETARECEGLLNAMVPMPEALSTTVKGSGDEAQTELHDGFTNWYDWAVARWGTKWDVSLEGLEYEQDEDGNYDNGGLGPQARITGWFDSAWAPPVTAMATYGESNPDVRITLDYNEPGMCFVGRATVEEGELVDDYAEYSDCDSKTVRAAIGEDLDDFWNISESMAEWEEESADEEEDA